MSIDKSNAIRQPLARSDAAGAACYHPSTLDIRWLIRRDMPTVVRIENECFDMPWATPWSEDEFITAVGQSNCVGMVARRLDTDDVIGYMIYLLNPGSLDLINMAVAPAYHRRGIGAAMIEKLIGKLTPTRRRTLRICVSERNTPAHLFLRSCGGRAEAIWSDYFDDCDDEMYEFVFRYGGAPGAATPLPDSLRA